MSPRTAQLTRTTRETDVAVSLRLDGEGSVEVRTGIGFLDHLLTALATHARLDVTLICKGDLHIDDHHTAEDCALTLGAALDQALGDRRGIARFGSAYAPLDESLARAVIDFSGRPFAAVDLGLRRDAIGPLACENIPHVLRSLATAARATLHVDVLRGENDHHRAEAAFKATALALRQAIAPDGSARIPSTKGTLS
jgi:imidazoleglycerol-phosphate dehydratase